MNLSLKSCCSPNRRGKPPDPAQYQHPDGKVRCEAAIHCGCKELLCPRSSSSRRPLPGPWGPLILLGCRCRGRAGFFRGSQPGSSPPSLCGCCWGSVTTRAGRGSGGEQGGSIAPRAADWLVEFCSQLCLRTSLGPCLRHDHGQVASLPTAGRRFPGLPAPKPGQGASRAPSMALLGAGQLQCGSEPLGTGRLS